jgi:methylase of polypeptide subunit release factors
MAEDPSVLEGMYAEVLSLMRQQTGSTEKEIEVMGRKFVLLPEVFMVSALQPILEYISHSPLKILADELKKRGPSAGLDVLEIGPGLGHFVVCAASMGPNVQVTAVDVNPAAVANVQRNAVLNGVSGRVHCGLGDVYTSPVTEGKRFDVIFWDPPFSKGDESKSSQANLERAVWDPGYAGLKQYISRAREFLKPSGRLLLAWNDYMGDAAVLKETANKHGWHLKLYGIAHFPCPTDYMTFLSYELVSEAPA